MHLLVILDFQEPVGNRMVNLMGSHPQRAGANKRTYVRSMSRRCPGR